MAIKSDKWIREQAKTKGMIEPFCEKQVAAGCISYGLSSYGYDLRVSNEFKIFTNVNSAIIDPKAFDERSFVSVEADSIFVPPNSFALARSVEYFRIPRDVLTICVGKSTYARCGIIVNVTPFEPEWEGFVTLEISNTTPLPAKVYANEGLCQILFFQSDEVCETSYADRAGKYQRQQGIVAAQAVSAMAASRPDPGVASRPDAGAVNRLQIGVVSSGPLRIVGLLAILECDYDVLPLTAPDALNRDGLAMVLIDAPEDDLFPMMSAFRRGRPALRLIVLGGRMDPPFVQKVVASGAKGYLHYTASEREVKMAIEIVADGSIWAPRKILASLIDTYSSAAPRPPQIRLTPREQEVIELLIAGRANREIASTLGMELKTVKTHVGKLLQKFGVPNRVALTVRAMEMQVNPEGR